MSTLVLLDMSSLVYPLFHMSGKEPDPDWTSKRAVSRVHELASNHPHVAVCVDSGRSFRKDIDPTYKANRPEKDGVLIHQLRLAQEQIAADGFPILKQDGYEADDLIASAALAACERDIPVLIASSDKDLMQLVCETVTVLSLASGNKYDAAGVKQKFGVEPSQMRDYLTLVGDSSDNIKGVRGIGEKTAADILGRFGSLDNLIEQIGKGADALGLKPSVYKAILESPDIINTARELVTLRTDAPIDIDALLKAREVAERAHEESAMNEELEGDVSTVEEPEAPATQAQAPSPAATALAPRPAILDAPLTGQFERQLEPRNLNDARTIAKWIHGSRLFSQYGTPEAVFSVVMAGRELGLSTMASLRAFHIVEGKPTMAADFLRALVIASGKAEYLICKERSAASATWETKRVGDPMPVTLTYTLAEAQAAGLVRDKSGWAKHPADMCAKTASAKLCRLVYPDVTFGLYATEEMDEAA